MYCGLSNHFPHKCLKVMNKQEKKAVLKTKNLNYICLKPGNFVAWVMFVRSAVKNIRLVFAVLIHTLL